MFLVVNKIDLVGEEEIKEFVQPFYNQMNFTELIPISAVKGTNLTTLLDKTYAVFAGRASVLPGR